VTGRGDSRVRIQLRQPRGELGDLRRLELPPGVLARRCGELELRGKEAPVAAYSLSG
jgi:hypothetical protein